jgi:hypothetical protein
MKRKGEKMKKRIAIAVVVVLVIVLIAQTSGWTEKLLAGNEAPVAAPGEADARPNGTVQFQPQKATTTGVGSCTATVNIGSVAEIETNLCLTASLEEKLPAEGPGKYVDGSLIMLTVVGEGVTQGGQTKVCYAAGPGFSAAAYYWKGSDWVKSTAEVADGKACVTVPADAPNPSYTALFE